VRSLAGQDEDASADNRAYSKGRKLNRTQNAAQSMLTRHLLQQQAERFSREQLASHSKDLPQKVVVWDRYRAIPPLVTFPFSIF
jgi:hypothetical protein